LANHFCAHALVTVPARLRYVPYVCTKPSLLFIPYHHFCVAKFPFIWIKWIRLKRNNIQSKSKIFLISNRIGLQNPDPVLHCSKCPKKWADGRGTQEKTSVWAVNRPIKTCH